MSSRTPTTGTPGRSQPLVRWACRSSHNPMLRSPAGAAGAARADGATAAMTVGVLRPGLGCIARGQPAVQGSRAAGTGVFGRDPCGQCRPQPGQNSTPHWARGSRTVAGGQDGGEPVRVVAAGEGGADRAGAGGHAASVGPAGVPPAGAAVPPGCGGEVLGLAAGAYVGQPHAAGLVAHLVHHHCVGWQRPVVCGPQEPGGPYGAPVGGEAAVGPDVHRITAPLTMILPSRRRHLCRRGAVVPGLRVGSGAQSRVGPPAAVVCGRTRGRCRGHRGRLAEVQQRQRIACRQLVARHVVAHLHAQVPALEDDAEPELG